MPDTSHALSLPLIQPSQAQKHVTHNEALRILDAVVQLVVIAADQSGPPTAPQSGDRYIVAPSGVGAWLGHDGDIAVYADAAWSFITPLPGWTAQVLAPQSAVLFDAVLGWQTVSTTLENTAELGINATADPTNRLSVSAPATLLNGPQTHRADIAMKSTMVRSDGWQASNSNVTEPRKQNCCPQRSKISSPLT